MITDFILLLQQLGPGSLICTTEDTRCNSLNVQEAELLLRKAFAAHKYNIRITLPLQTERQRRSYESAFRGYTAAAIAEKNSSSETVQTVQIV
jgi:hypothetical protein